MKEENIGVLSAGERFGFKGFEWIVLDNNVDGGVLAIIVDVPEGELSEVAERAENPKIK